MGQLALGRMAASSAAGRDSLSPAEGYGWPDGFGSLGADAPDPESC